jgi:hypothetical protein
MILRWSLVFSSDQGIHGCLRLVVDGATASFLAQVALPDVGVVVVRDDELVPPRLGRGRDDMLVVRAEGLWVELLCETPDEHWSIGLEAFGVRFDDEAEAAASDRGERIALGFDLEWETPDRVFGEVLVGRTRLELDATGTFTVQSGPQRLPGPGTTPSNR